MRSLNEGNRFSLTLLPSFNFFRERNNCNLFSIKFGISEKHNKFEKIFLTVLTNQLIYLGNIHVLRNHKGGRGVKTTKTRLRNTWMRKIFSNYVCFSKIDFYGQFSMSKKSSESFWSYSKMRKNLGSFLCFALI